MKRRRGSTTPTPWMPTDDPSVFVRANGDKCRRNPEGAIIEFEAILTREEKSPRVEKPRRGDDTRRSVRR